MTVVIILYLFASVENSFEKITVCNEIGDFIGFSKFNFQNGSISFLEVRISIFGLL